ncbi:MAG: hypothetical protein ABW046_17960, partial [Actinoplanes sp.]
PDLLRAQLRTSAQLWRANAGILSCAATAVVSYQPLREFLTRVKTRYDERAADKIRRDQADGTATTAIAADRLAEMISALRDARYEQLDKATDDDLERAVDDLTEAILRLVYGSR